VNSVKPAVSFVVKLTVLLNMWFCWCTVKFVRGHLEQGSELHWDSVHGGRQLAGNEAGQRWVLYSRQSVSQHHRQHSYCQRVHHWQVSENFSLWVFQTERAICICWVWHVHCTFDTAVCAHLTFILVSGYLSICPLTPVSCDTMSPYLVEGLNETRHKYSSRGIAEKVFRVRGQCNHIVK